MHHRRLTKNQTTFEPLGHEQTILNNSATAADTGAGADQTAWLEDRAANRNRKLARSCSTPPFVHPTF